MTQLLAFHNDPAIKALTPDELAFCCLRDGAVFVDPFDGSAYTIRCGQYPRKLGTENAAGYLVCTLHFKGQRKQVKLHRLIWLATWGAIPSGYMPDHINQIRNDNRAINLRLVTAKGNAENRRSYAGEANPAAVLTSELVETIRNTNASYSTKARIFGVSKSLIAQISRRELWK